MKERENTWNHFWIIGRNKIWRRDRRVMKSRRRGRTKMKRKQKSLGILVLIMCLEDFCMRWTQEWVCSVSLSYLGLLLWFGEPYVNLREIPNIASRIQLWWFPQFLMIWSLSICFQVSFMDSTLTFKLKERIANWRRKLCLKMRNHYAKC